MALRAPLASVHLVDRAHALVVGGLEARHGGCAPLLPLPLKAQAPAPRHPRGGGGRGKPHVRAQLNDLADRTLGHRDGQVRVFERLQELPAELGNPVVHFLEEAVEEAHVGGLDHGLGAPVFPDNLLVLAPLDVLLEARGQGHQGLEPPEHAQHAPDSFHLPLALQQRPDGSLGRGVGVREGGGEHRGCVGAPPREPHIAGLQLPVDPVDRVLARDEAFEVVAHELPQLRGALGDVGLQRLGPLLEALIGGVLVHTGQVEGRVELLLQRVEFLPLVGAEEVGGGAAMAVAMGVLGPLEVGAHPPSGARAPPLPLPPRALLALALLLVVLGQLAPLDVQDAEAERVVDLTALVVP
mmetsp:Transcript_14781/g.47134  ORF Transcript_14781/g.47134 Transcript_14781/m.47134 type:complete len:354 (+) Transcript_14781:653-1714(+)